MGGGIALRLGILFLTSKAMFRLVQKFNIGVYLM